jgi:hypothetical protein
VKDLEEAYKELQKSVKEDEKQKKAEDRQKKKDLQQEKKLLGKALQQANKDATKKTQEVTKLVRSLNQVETNIGKTTTKKGAQQEKLDETLRKLREDKHRVEAIVQQKRQDMMEARGRLDNIERALALMHSTGSGDESEGHDAFGTGLVDDDPERQHHLEEQNLGAQIQDLEAHEQELVDENAQLQDEIDHLRQLLCNAGRKEERERQLARAQAPQTLGGGNLDSQATEPANQTKNATALREVSPRGVPVGPAAPCQGTPGAAFPCPSGGFPVYAPYPGLVPGVPGLTPRTAMGGNVSTTMISALRGAPPPEPVACARPFAAAAAGQKRGSITDVMFDSIDRDHKGAFTRQDLKAALTADLVAAF